MYPYNAALVAIDQNTGSIMACLMLTVIAAFFYFLVAVWLTFKHKVYVTPFIPNAVFLWHDVTFVAQYDLWFNHYNHWWLKMWWFALCGTVALELGMMWLIFKFGHKELWPHMSRGAFGIMLILGTLGIGTVWYLIKVSMGDELFFITFAITAVLSVPFHTAILSRRQSRAGQSIAMQLSTMVMLGCETLAFIQVDPFFKTLPYMLFFVAFMSWPLANIYLITRFPKFAA